MTAVLIFFLFCFSILIIAVLGKNTNSSKLSTKTNKPTPYEIEQKLIESIIYSKNKSLDYQYLEKYGVPYGYKKEGSLIKTPQNGLHFSIDYSKSIDFMSPEELKKAAEYIKKERLNEENKLKKRELERKWKELEIKKQETKRKKEDEQRNFWNYKWIELQNHIKFEVDKSKFSLEKRGIYVIHCVVTNQIYIGSTYDILNRKSQHLSQLRNKKHHSFKLQNAFNEYGEGNFKFYLLELVKKETIKMMGIYQNDDMQIDIAIKQYQKSREQYFINKFNPDFNIDDDTTGRRHWENKLWN